MANHGKKLGYFKVPNLSSSKRRSRMRKEDTYVQENAQYAEPKNLEKTSAEKIQQAIDRGSKYVIQDI